MAVAWQPLTVMFENKFKFMDIIGTEPSATLAASKHLPRLQG
jgi:hypothetical protein